MKHTTASPVPSDHLARPFDYARLCVSLCDELEALAHSEGVVLAAEIKAAALQIFEGDAARTKLAAACLVRHAIKRVPGGKVKLCLKVTRSQTATVLSVCDNGPPFTKKGETLDLLMARCVARFLGGKVVVSHKRATGGHIRLTLPFAVASGLTRNDLISRGA